MDGEDAARMAPDRDPTTRARELKKAERRRNNGDDVGQTQTDCRRFHHTFTRSHGTKHGFYGQTAGTGFRHKVRGEGANSVATGQRVAERERRFDSTAEWF